MPSLYQVPHEIATEIAMSKDGIPWLAVEGVTDERLFRSRHFPCNVKIVVATGWEGVRDVLVGVSASQVNTVVIGLIDRDYRDHNRSQPNLPRLVLTDLRDIEGMMFWSSALHRVYCELGSDDKLPKDKHVQIDYETIRTQIIRTCIKLGRFRANCFISGKNISFQDLDYNKFVCDRSLILDESKLIAHLRGRNPGATCINMHEWEASQHLDKFDKERSSAQCICHGHDLMALVAISLRRKWGTCAGAHTREKIESTFRVGYGDDDLAATSMWRDICGFLAIPNFLT